MSTNLFVQNITIPILSVYFCFQTMLKPNFRHSENNLSPKNGRHVIPTTCGGIWRYTVYNEIMQYHYPIAVPGIM